MLLIWRLWDKDKYFFILLFSFLFSSFFFLFFSVFLKKKKKKIKDVGKGAYADIAVPSFLLVMAMMVAFFGVAYLATVG